MSTTQDPHSESTSKPLMQEPFAAPSHVQPENEFAYRTYSKAAIASLLFAILGALVSFVSAAMIWLPLMAVLFGVSAIFSFRKYPEELAGKLMANIGLILGTILLVTSTCYHTYVYNTEVPEGYQRISYGELRPNKRTPAPFSEKAEAFNGKKVFLKGYVRPSDRKKNLKNFILVGDFGDCCFGGNPKPTDVVAIRIQTDQTVDHSLSLRKIGGTFRLNSRPRRTGDDEVPHIFYEIEADHIQ